MIAWTQRRLAIDELNLTTTFTFTDHDDERCGAVVLVGCIMIFFLVSAIYDPSSSGWSMKNVVSGRHAVCDDVFVVFIFGV